MKIQIQEGVLDLQQGDISVISCVIWLKHDRIKIDSSTASGGLE